MTFTRRLKKIAPLTSFCVSVTYTKKAYRNFWASSEFANENLFSRTPDTEPWRARAQFSQPSWPFNCTLQRIQKFNFADIFPYLFRLASTCSLVFVYFRLKSYSTTRVSTAAVSTNVSYMFEKFCKNNFISVACSRGNQNEHFSDRSALLRALFERECHTPRRQLSFTQLVWLNGRGIVK